MAKKGMNTKDKLTALLAEKEQAGSMPLPEQAVSFPPAETTDKTPSMKPVKGQKYFNVLMSREAYNIAYILSKTQGSPLYGRTMKDIFEQSIKGYVNANPKYKSFLKKYKSLFDEQ